jgi:hypothetical protein
MLWFSCKTGANDSGPYYRHSTLKTTAAKYTLLLEAARPQNPSQIVKKGKCRCLFWASFLSFEEDISVTKTER